MADTGRPDSGTIWAGPQQRRTLRQVSGFADTRVPPAVGAVPQQPTTQACGHAETRARPAADTSLDCGGTYAASAAVSTLDSRASERSTIRRSRDAACFCDGDKAWP
jgi:hypothetical protein